MPCLFGQHCHFQLFAVQFCNAHNVFESFFKDRIAVILVCLKYKYTKIKFLLFFFHSFCFELTSVLRLVLLFSFFGSIYNLTYGSGMSEASLIGRCLKINDTLIISTAHTYCTEEGIIVTVLYSYLILCIMTLRRCLATLYARVSFMLPKGPDTSSSL